MRDNYGDVRTQVINQYAGRPAVSWPHRVGVVPPVAAGYQPRTDPAVDLDRVFEAASGTAGLTGVVAGMGGVGKTQLAAAHVHQAWDTGGVDLLVWLTATSRDAIITGYAQTGADVASPPEGEDTEQVAQRFLAWLAATEKRWLVVLDDLADPADLKGLWPQGRAGRVLVTTRRRDAALADRGTVIGVDLFTLDEARAYLAGRLDPADSHPERLEEAGELAEDLGRLPLALAQAAAYMRDRELTCAGYRRRLARRRLELALPADAAAGDYAGTVATTWSLSVELADQLPPTGLARPLLTLTALLDPHGIPTAVLTTEAVRAYLAAPESAGTSSPADPPPSGLPHDQEPASSAVDEELLDEDVEDVLSSLHRLSLLTLTRDQEPAEDSWVRVHPLVQRATREQADPQACEAAARAAADGLVQAWPDQDYQPNQSQPAQSLRDNTDALARIAPDPLWVPQAHAVLFRAGRSRIVAGLLIQAVAYWTALTATAEQALGSDHPDTLASRAWLARAYEAAGRLAEALPLFERVLADAERALGPDHPDTLASRTNLALAYQTAGRLQAAVPLSERVVADCERVLGPDHTHTLASRSNLAVAYRDARRLAEAVPLSERVVADCERVLGADHPDTLASRSNLALTYEDAGRPLKALPLLKRALADFERLLGADHPNTLTGRSNLALAYRDAGRLAEALPLLERTLADRERVLGAGHPDTLTNRTNLAGAYQLTGRLVEAVSLFGQVVVETERLLGAVHPRLAVALFLLGQAQAKLGDLASAVAAFGRAAEVNTAAYGPDHPEVATDLEALAAVEDRQGNVEGAAASRARAQRIRDEQQGPGSAPQ